jgi:hypothetical protein
LVIRELCSHLGRHQAKPLDAEAEKRSGWREHGILVVAESDRRLTWPERELVRQLGAKLYGRRSEGD